MQSILLCAVTAHTAVRCNSQPILQSLGKFDETFGVRKIICRKRRRGVHYAAHTAVRYDIPNFRAL